MRSFYSLERRKLAVQMTMGRHLAYLTKATESLFGFIFKCWPFHGGKGLMVFREGLRERMNSDNLTERIGREKQGNIQAVIYMQQLSWRAL